MVATYDPGTDAGKVRLLVTDTDVAFATFSDEEIGAFLGMYGGNVHRAAGQALMTIATSEVLVMKRITLLDLNTDGPAEAKALMARAEALFEQADRFEDGNGFDWAEMVVNPATFVDRVWAQAMRGAR